MTEQQYLADVEELGRIFGNEGYGERIDELADRIWAYEEEHYPIGSPESE